MKGFSCSILVFDVLKLSLVQRLDLVNWSDMIDGRDNPSN